MGLRKCPRCELNYIRDDETYCNVCCREMKGKADTEEIAMCIECGEVPALPGTELCAACQREVRRREKLEKLKELHIVEDDLDVDVDELDEIDVPAEEGDIPTEELQEIHRGLREEDDEDAEEDDPLEDDLFSEEE